MKAFSSRPLPKMRVSLTDWCNFHCSFCGGMKFGMENWRVEKQSPLSREELYSVIKAYRELGGYDVHLTGGEPLGRNDIVDIVKQVIALHGRVELNTNGSLLTEEVTNQLVDAGLSLLKIALHSSDANRNYKITGANFFQQTKNAIQYASKRLPVRTNMVVARSNLDEIMPLIEISNSLGAQSIHLLDLTYYPNWSPELVDNWSREFVPLSLIVAPLLTNRFGGEFVDLNIFGCKFFELRLPNGFRVVLKEAEPTLRHPVFCKGCPSYCHEGMFTVRVSVDGYINICPGETPLGFDARQAIRNGNLREELARLFGILDETESTASWSTFLKVNLLRDPTANPRLPEHKGPFVDILQ